MNINFAVYDYRYILVVTTVRSVCDARAQIP